jgi:hypothetical protein
MSGGFDAGGEWAIQFPKHDGIKFHAVFAGQCWVCIEGLHEPIQIRAGDCFLLPSGRPFRIATDLALKPVERPQRPSTGWFKHGKKNAAEKSKLSSRPRFDDELSTLRNVAYFKFRQSFDSFFERHRTSDSKVYFSFRSCLCKNFQFFVSERHH